MFAELKPYPATRPSGVDWFGDVPEHWAVVPYRALFTEVNERGRPDEEMLSVTIASGVTRQQTLLADSSRKDGSRLDKSNYKLVRPGDIAYNKMRAWQGAVGVSDYRGIVSPAYVVVRPRDRASSRYLHYLLRTPAFAKEAERWSYGITSDMWSLRPEHFKMIYGCLPPPEEQTAIARYLDHVDRRIGRYIQAKQRLIELLEEQKQAIVHEAVTRGLDPDVPLKPSGVEWLGDVPEHWEVRRLKTVLARNDSGVWGAEAYGSEGTLVLRSTEQTVDGDWAITDPARRTLSPQEKAGAVLTVGDLVVTTSSGSDLHIGKTSLVTDRVADLGACFSNFMQRLRCLPTFDPRLAWYVLNSRAGRQQLVFNSNTTTGLANLNGTILGNLTLAVPPPDEQTAMVGYLDGETAVIDTAIDRAHREIELLDEYRTRLIADVVTGKVDVRAAAADLPEGSAPDFDGAPADEFEPELEEIAS